LNIPVGILPLPDCKSCIVSSVGRIWKLTDTDDDGKADKREILLSGFGTEDTHGMTNSFTLLPDGWVYATHGYKNTSKVKGTDGSTITMQSGNTYRFRPDGSHVEHWTFGQVNPFGMTVDPWFNLYTADCHSKPITQLIRGAYYDSFGKPHDGLGFAPHVTRHDHGSTALCGLAWYDADHFPKEWKGCMFLGNVVTNRINADRIVWHGSTPEGKELPDFLVSRDPWFRPTDIKLGPDGALYVADFYNKIIGHYEVDLHHPGRDKDHGRVWRIVWKGTDGKAKPPKMPRADWTKATLQELYFDARQSLNLTVRSIARSEALRRLGKDAAPETATARLATLLTDHNGPDPATKLPDDSPALANLLLLVHLRSESSDQDATVRRWASQLLTATPRFQRAWVEALIAHPHADNVAPLVALIQKCPAEDTHLRHAARIALRNTLHDAKGGWAAAETADPAVIGDVAAGVHTKEAAAFVLKQVQAGKAEPRFCEHVGRYGDDAQAAAAVAALKEKPAPVFAVQSLVRGLQARGGKVPPDTTAVAEAACVRAMKKPNVYTLAATSDLAGELKLANLFDPLAKFAANAKRPEGQRATAMTALVQIDPVKAAPVLGRTLTDAKAPDGLRERAAAALAGANVPAAREALLAALSAAPARLSVAIATGLASSPQGAVTLLDAIKQGKASPRLLQEKGVAFRIALHDGGKLKPRMDELTRGLPSVDARVGELIRTRAASFGKAKPSAVLGKKVFTQHCAACHQIGGEGQKIGPQLDGIGNRGAERLLEDILDPNRNVDAAFRATVLNLADGRTLTGLLVREEGQVLVLADAAGKEVRVPRADVEKRTTTTLSPMPANFDTAIPEADFHHLLAYLLEQRAKDSPAR
ncbi:MAG TPA: c-type cytochrome, partial [Fimbriiglobus sp.]|nr:c-type cytochrome [Fimbriiglobus sp.]